MKRLRIGLEKNDQLTIAEWIIAGVLFSVFFGSYLYVDICQTAPSSLNIWNSLLDGNVLGFYSYHYEGVKGSYIPNGVTGGAYDLVLYIIFAVYNFPLWIYELITGTSFLDAYLGRVYMKGILALFAILSAWMIKKIVCLLSDDSKLSLWAMFLFLFSHLTVSTVIVIGGYDILSVFFTLAGLYFYLKNDNGKFVLFFAIATVCKMFALWIYIPLVLLKEKKIHKILLYGVGSISLIVIPKVLTAIVNLIGTGSEGSATDVAVKGNQIIAHSNIINDKLFNGNIGPISFGNIPLLFVAMLLIWWFCWKKKNVTQYEIIFACAVSMSSFFLFADTYPYWIILLVPYIVLLLVLNPVNIVDNTILEGVFSVGYIISSACVRRQCYNMNLLVYMLKPDCITVQGEMDYVDFGISSIMLKFSQLIGISYENITSLFLTCFAVGLILFLWYNRPGKQDGVMDMCLLRRCVIVRTMVALCVAMIPMLGVLDCLFTIYL